jgi:hypothetical protein
VNEVDSCPSRDVDEELFRNLWRIENAAHAGALALPASDQNDGCRADNEEEERRVPTTR